MKNNNRKGVILLEAAIAITVLLICLYFLTALIGITSKQHSRSIDVVASQNIKKVTNQVDYLKRALIERGKATSYAKQNLIYAGWDVLEITPQGETINELDGEYLLSTTCGSIGIQGLCLRKLVGDEWGYLKIAANTQKYKEVNTNSELDGGKIDTGTNQAGDCEALSEDCQAYKIIIKDASGSKYEPITYKESGGSIKTITPAKTISIIIKNSEIEAGEQELPKFNYLLTVY